jgi:hypothetical protein
MAEYLANYPSRAIINVALREYFLALNKCLEESDCNSNLFTHYERIVIFVSRSDDQSHLIYNKFLHFSWLAAREGYFSFRFRIGVRKLSLDQGYCVSLYCGFRFDFRYDKRFSFEYVIILQRV